MWRAVSMLARAAAPSCPACWNSAVRSATRSCPSMTSMLTDRRAGRDPAAHRPAAGVSVLRHGHLRPILRAGRLHTGVGRPVARKGWRCCVSLRAELRGLRCQHRVAASGRRAPRPFWPRPSCRNSARWRRPRCSGIRKGVRPDPARWRHSYIPGEIHDTQIHSARPGVGRAAGASRRPCAHAGRSARRQDVECGHDGLRAAARFQEPAIQSPEGIMVDVAAAVARHLGVADKLSDAISA